MSHLPKTLLLAAVGIVAALMGVLLAQSVLKNSSPPILTSGTLLQPAKPVPEFTLVDHTDSLFTAARLHDRWSLVFFGFANCADVCPTTLTTLAATTKSLVDLPPALQPQVVFVSVDAARDSTKVLSAYIKAFDPAFIAVTGAQSELDMLTKSLGVPSAIRPFENGSYAVDHYAGILAINPRGELQALFGAPHTVAALSSDYRTLIGAPR